MGKPLITHTDYDNLDNVLDDIPGPVDMSEPDRITKLEIEVDHLTTLVYIMWPALILLIAWLTNH